MNYSELKNKKIIIVLDSLVAEGCPMLALQLARYWKSIGIESNIIIMNDRSNEMREDFERMNIKIYTLKLGRGILRYAKLTYFSWLISRKIKAYAVLSFPLGWHTFIAIGSKIGGAKRVCAHVGNLPPYWNKVSFTKFKILIQCGRIFTDKLICCSNYIREACIKDFSIDRSETEVIYNSCGNEFFNNSSFKNISTSKERKYVLAMVARLEIHKDQETFISACSILNNMGIYFESWLIGDGSKRDKLESEVDKLSLKNKVIFLGSRRNIVEILKKVDLFVFSAKRDEGFGIAIAEAMALGIPIVASNVGACREVLDNGKCGYLVPPNNPLLLANEIIFALNNNIQTVRKINSAKVKANSLFKSKSMGANYAKELFK